MIDFSKDVKIAVACPSYRRPHCKTARYVKDVNIYIDKSDYESYKQENEGYGNIVVCEDGIQGNLPRVRNYILDKEFENGADIVVMMDDDVEYLELFKPDYSEFGYNRKKILDGDFYDFIEYGSLLCQEFGFGMWGVNYNDDKLLYRTFQPLSTVKCAVGQFMVFVKNELSFDETLPLKEDYDMALQQIEKYRGILLINFVHVCADMGKLSGGTSVRRNFEAEHSQFLKFRKKWGSEVVVGARRAAGQGKGMVNNAFVNTYDFSHPIVRGMVNGV